MSLKYYEITFFDLMHKSISYYCSYMAMPLSELKFCLKVDDLNFLGWFYLKSFKKNQHS